MADNQQGGSRETPPPLPGLVRREQPTPLLLPRETTEYINARGKEEATTPGDKKREPSVANQLLKQHFAIFFIFLKTYCYIHCFNSG